MRSRSRCIIIFALEKEDGTELKKQPIPEEEPLKVSAAVIRNTDGAVLVARRRTADGAPGMWEFPGGKIEAGEHPRQSLKREIMEELGVDIDVSNLLCIIKKDSGASLIELIVFEAMIIDGDPSPLVHEELAWVRPGSLDEDIFSEPDRPVIRLLKVGRRAEGRTSEEAKPGRNRTGWPAGNGN